MLNLLFLAALTLAEKPTLPALSWPSVPLWADSADLVVVATAVLDRPKSGTPSMHLHIARTLKGRADAEAIDVPLEGVERLGDGKAIHGLWFLSRRPDGGWTLPSSEANPTFLDRWLVRLPAGDLPPAWRWAASTLLVDKLVSELRAAAESEDEEVVSGAFWSIGEFVRLAEQPDRGSTPAGTWGAELAAVRRLLQHHLADAAHTPTCPTALTLREWDRIVIGRVERYAAAGRAARLPFGVFASLESVHEPAVLPGLTRLLEAAETGAFGVRPVECLRNSVPVGSTGLMCYEPTIAQAIHNIHTAEALPQLARLLDSPSLESQYMAVQGFALHALRRPSSANWTTGDRPPDMSREEFEFYCHNLPAVGTFEQDPTAYTAFWKAWYAERAATLLSGR